MSIKVIGAGFPRTGTSSLKIALQKLGFGECYHMKNLLIDPAKLKFWNEIEAKGTTNYSKLFDGFHSIVDIPGYLYLKELMKEYPDAKIILTTRPFDVWHASVRATVFQAVYPSFSTKLKLISKAIRSRRIFRAMKCVQMVERKFFDEQFQKQFENRQLAESLYNKHIEDVKKAVSSEKLLIYEPGDGWESLCAFLNVPQPNEAYPHANKRENFQEMMKHLLKGEMV